MSKQIFVAYVATGSHGGLKHGRCMVDVEAGGIYGIEDVMRVEEKIENVTGSKSVSIQNWREFDVEAK